MIWQEYAVSHFEFDENISEIICDQRTQQHKKNLGLQISVSPPGDDECYRAALLAEPVSLIVSAVQLDKHQKFPVLLKVRNSFTDKIRYEHLIHNPTEDYYKKRKAKRIESTHK